MAAAAFYVITRTTSENALWDTITALGMMICFYYGITALACVWFFRAEAFSGARAFFFKFLAPLLGGVILLVMFVKTAYDSMDPEYGSGSSVGGVGMVFILGMGVILLGVVLMLVMARIRPEFFKGQVLARGKLSRLVRRPGRPRRARSVSGSRASAHWKVSTLTNRLGRGGTSSVGTERGDSMSDTESISKVTDIINDSHIGMFTTINEEGALVSRPLAVQEVKDDGDMWFFTSVGNLPGGPHPRRSAGERVLRQAHRMGVGGRNGGSGHGPAKDPRHVEPDG